MVQWQTHSMPLGMWLSITGRTRERDSHVLWPSSVSAYLAECAISVWIFEAQTFVLYSMQRQIYWIRMVMDYYLFLNKQSNISGNTLRFQFCSKYTFQQLFHELPMHTLNRFGCPADFLHLQCWHVSSSKDTLDYIRILVGILKSICC